MKNASSKSSSSQGDLLDQKNFEKNEEMVIQRPIENTPFHVVGLLNEQDDERRWFASLGNIRLTEFVKSEKEAIKLITPVTWKNIVTLIAGLDAHKLQSKKQQTL
jgi:hypothetical protein